MGNEIKANLSASNEPTLDHMTSLKQILNQSKEITVDLENAADQLGSVNAVLKNDDKVIPPFPTVEEVIAQNEEAEKKVEKAAGDLHQINIELNKQVVENHNIKSEPSQNP
ncbi:MAG: hypothetical protein DCE90_11590 [Pseudanabaena sp.]|nr:MAG: hypothetical protein DCE90_11590 [Pseudanabaena sp.]